MRRKQGARIWPFRLCLRRARRLQRSSSFRQVRLLACWHHYSFRWHASVNTRKRPSASRQTETLGQSTHNRCAAHRCSNICELPHQAMFQTWHEVVSCLVYPQYLTLSKRRAPQTLSVFSSIHLRSARGASQQQANPGPRIPPHGTVAPASPGCAASTNVGAGTPTLNTKRGPVVPASTPSLLAGVPPLASRP